MKTCKHDGPRFPCDRPAVAKGYCQLHYYRNREGRTMDWPADLRTDCQKPYFEATAFCPGCKKSLPPEKFSRSKYGKLQYLCKKCASAYQKKKYHANPEKYRQKALARYYKTRKIVKPYAEKRPGFKLCYMCKEWLRESAFYKDRSHSTGLSSRCKKCDNQRREDRRETRKQSYRSKP